MRGVDLRRFEFDFDLTFAALLMHPDGHVYHRYGGRDYRGAMKWVSLKSLETLLMHTLKDHEQYQAAAPAKAISSAEESRSSQPLTLERMPAFQKRDKGECIHCHSIFPAFHEEQMEAKTWSLDKIWRHPSPTRIGLDLDRDDQRLVVAVEAASPAALAGVHVGDRLQSVAGVEVMTASDVMFQLDIFPLAGGVLEVQLKRAGEEQQVRLSLEPAWKRGTPLSFSWRPSKWGLTPAPGFGGRLLDREELLEAGHLPDADEVHLPFALRVTYLVTWGENSRYGRAAVKAGLRDGDIVTAIGGKRDFESVEHFHSWWRLTRTVGELVELEIWREGVRRTMTLKVIR